MRVGAGDFLPPPIGLGYLGQNWAQGRSLTENLGGLVTAQLTRAWSLAAGVFRSTADNPLSFTDLYTDIQPNGRSEHLVVGYPDQSAYSTSGEARLTGRFTAGDWRHELIFLARGRDVLARYGGDDVVDVGQAIIGTGQQVPEPELGVQQARGVELSIAGRQIEHFDINVGVLAAKVSIMGPDLAAQGVGPIALGQPRLQYVANVNYTVPWWPVLSLDAAATHFGSEPGTVDNGVYSPAVTWLNVGGRFKFTVFGKNSTLRVQIQNAPNSSWWTNVYTPGFFEWPAPRTVFAYVTTDL